jgi:excisionase family DNA binding protein
MAEIPAKLLTVNEVAELLRVHANTVRQWSDQGLLKSYRIGPRGDRRFRQEDISKFINLESNHDENAVLIVDDDFSVCDVLREVVESKGYSVVIVNSGENALEELARQKFSLIFLDLVLPGLSGAEVLRYLKTIKSDAIVVVVSGYGDSPVATEAMSLGPIFFVHKPFEVATIRDIIDLTVRIKNYGYQP